MTSWSGTGSVCRRHRLWTGPAVRTHARPARRQPVPGDPPRRAPPPRAAGPPPVAGRQDHHQRRHPCHLRPCATAPGSRASGSACNSSPPAPGIRLWPAYSAAAPAAKTTTPAKPSSRSPYTPTSSGSPHAASGRTAPATARVLTVSRSPLIAVAAAGPLLPEGFSRRRTQPGYRSGDDQG